MKKLPFTEVITDVTSKFKKIKQSDYQKSGVFQIIDQGKEYVSGYTDDANLVNQNLSPVIIFGDHTRVLKYVETPIALGADGAKALWVNPKIAYSHYVFFYLKSLKLKDAGYSRHFKFLKELKIPIPFKDGEPAINDQIRIATLFSRVEALIATRKDNLRLLDEFLKSTFLEMFGDIRAKKSKHPWEKPHPYLKANSGKSSKNVLSDGKTNFPIYGGNGINGYANEALYLKPVVIAGRVGQQCGVIHVSDGPCWVTDNAIVLEIKNSKKLNTTYLAYCYRHSPIREKVEQLDLPFINQSMLLDALIPMPPIELQNQFSAIVEKTESLKNHYQQNLTELENLYGALSQKAFKGELDLFRIPIQPESEQEIDRLELVTTTTERVPENIETTLASLNEFNQNASILKDITRAARAASIDTGHFESIKKAAAQIAAYHSPMEQLKNMSGIASAIGQIESIIKPLNLNQFDVISRSAELACNMASAIPRLDMGWLEQHNDLLKQATAPFGTMRSAMQGIEALNYSGVNALIAKGAAVSGLIDHHSEALRKATELPASVRATMDQLNSIASYTDPYRHLLGASWQSRLGYDPTTMASTVSMYPPPPFDYDDVIDVLTNAGEPITLEDLLQQLDEVGIVDLKGYERIKVILFDLLAENKVTQVFDEKQNKLLFAIVKDESPQ